MSDESADDCSALRAELAAVRGELERSQLDLAGFAQVVSHDLRGPLSVMLGFAGLIKERAALPAGDPARGHLDEVMRAGERIDAIIAALLRYVRNTQAPLVLERVPISELAHKVRRDLALTREVATRAQLEIEALAPVIADPSLLDTLLRNLLDNALRFADPHEPRVRFGQARELPGQVFIVEDNGPGFDPKHRERLFLPFQHLSAGEPGAGVGLATCARIVRRHGGRIWADSHPGQGARFFFTLCAADPQADR